jgi:hypothetical protein
LFAIIAYACAQVCILAVELFEAAVTERADGPLFASVAGVAKPERPVNDAGLLIP